MSGADALILERLSKVSVGTLVHVMQSSGIGRCFMVGVRPVTSAAGFVGRARTLSTVPVREDLLAARQAQPKSADPHRKAIDEIGTGEVLVIAARGRVDAATLGDLLAQRMRTSGAAAVVTDGAVRDLSALDEIGLPIFAGGVSAPTFGTRHLGLGVNTAVGCGEVTVEPGDFLVGDPEGVVVVPAASADETGSKALEQERRDAFLRQKIADGMALRDAYPPNPVIQAEYEALRQGGTL